MREIKFRAKDIKTNEWVYGGYFYERALNKHFIYGEYGSIYEVDANTIGQYTGLKDKNGREVYEGDIYNLGDKNITYVVVWDDTGFIGKQLKSKSYAGLSFWQNKMEIMGNRYENPELLRV